MANYLLLFLISISFTSCFTAQTIEKAKLDRKSETVKKVLSSYYDENKNTNIIYTKRGSNKTYKVFLPIDSTFREYRESKEVNWGNVDSINNFKGVFFTENINNERGFQRTILLGSEIAIPDSLNLREEIAHDRGVAESYNKKHYTLISPNDPELEYKEINAKSISFIIHVNNSDSLYLRKETYLISFIPKRKSNN